MFDFDRLPPAEQIAQLMQRIYRHGLTTTSGGNLSLRGADGVIYISPSGTDKGTLGGEDVVAVHPDGRAIGRHKPSVEYPFHRAIYDARPDIRAIVHAHPVGLVAFSVVRKAPDTRIVPQARQICGRVGFAAYAIPGSELLGRNISRAFSDGFDSVLLENHGAVCGGSSLLHAFHRFETLEFCARLHVQARRLGEPRMLQEDELALFGQESRLDEYAPAPADAAEMDLRGQMTRIIHRACAQGLMTSTEGTLSARLPDGLLITPTGVDRQHLQEMDLVAIRSMRRPAGSSPSRAAGLHDAIYRAHPEVSAIFSAQPPHVMAFAVTSSPLDIRMIPESYFVLRDVPRVPFAKRNDHAHVAGLLAPNSPCLMLENDALLTTGASILQAFDRLEVAEFTARSILDATLLGGAVAMGDEQIAEIREAFF